MKSWAFANSKYIFSLFFGLLISAGVEAGQALEWKRAKSIVHLAGYGDVSFTDTTETRSEFVAGHFSPIFHFLYDDLVLFESELEFEVEDGKTGTTLEYLTIDWFLNDYITVVVGKFLSPIGQFRQNLHPSWINKLPSEPVGFGHHGGAAPIGEIGLQLRGGVPVGPTKINYAVYAGNGPTLEVEGTEVEIHTDGLNGENNSNKIFGGRFGFLPIPEIELGGSGAYAKAKVSGEANRDYYVWGVDGVYQPRGRFKGVELRGEFVRTVLGSGGTTDPERKELQAWYAQGSYLWDKFKVQPVVRYGESTAEVGGHAHDEEDAGSDEGSKTRQLAAGLNYLFANHFIAKAAYEWNFVNGGVNAHRLLLQMAFGF